jgi:hypothetical protein
MIAQMLDEGNALAGAKELWNALYGSPVLVAMQHTAR